MDDQEIPKSRYLPSFGKRLLWWFGIYLVLQLPLIQFFPFFWLFPNGLIKYFFHVDPTVPDGPALLGFPVLFLVGWSLYLAHLVLSLLVPSKKAFIILMAILIVLVSLNVRSCRNEIREDETKPDLGGTL